MSEILLLYASRYGSTSQISEMIAGHLEKRGCSVTAESVSGQVPKPGQTVLLGSGIYSHKLLPDMEKYIEKHRGELLNCRVGMFGIAMRTETVHRNGRAIGGELILDKYGLNPFVKGMLHGRMDFSLLTEKDRSGLERFYHSIGLTEEQKSERRKLRDEISDDECADFARRTAEGLVL